MSDRSIQSIKQQIKRIKSRYQPPQRTPEWYEQRNLRITASEVANCLTLSELHTKPYVEMFGISNFKYNDKKCMNPYESFEKYVIKKCDGFFGNNVFYQNEHTIWGNKYEEVACLLYQELKNVKVEEYGLVPHSRLKWLGASPDGITTNGIMLEIKCPKTRKINNSYPPLYYFSQVQIQMECCNLDECDFLECQIIECESENEWNDIIINDPLSQKKGIIFIDNEQSTSDKTIYIYNSQFKQPEIWLNEINELNKKTNSSLFTPIYYFIEKFNIINIKRSKQWFENVKSTLKEKWEFIRHYQNNYDDFIKYKNAIYQLENQKYLNLFDQTKCDLDTIESFIPIQDPEITAIIIKDNVSNVSNVSNHNYEDDLDTC